MNTRVLAARLAALVVLAGAAGAAAQSTPSNGDPVLPESLRHRPPGESPRGKALDALVERKLRAQFDAADSQGRGRVDREQARAARWALVQRHFDEIDAGRAGSVSFDDVMRYMRQRREAAR